MADVIGFEKRLIKGKPIYIFEAHNVALLAWADIRASRSSDLLLLTLDYHTDVLEAFVRSAYPGATGFIRASREEHLACMNERVARVDWRNDQSVREAVADLRNDEHIDAAIKLGLLDLAFCFNRGTNTPSVEEDRYIKNYSKPFGSKSPQPPFSYLVPANKIFAVSETCFVGCKATPHNDDCEKPFADQAIESVMLRRLLDRANCMARFAGIDDIKSSAFVLDIDLDYFRTVASLSPSDPTVFRELIRKAAAVTIATEPSYVQQLRLDDRLASDYALEKIIAHIHAALGS